ncbi:MAG: 30S ribosome-binding factor RbfA [Gammaproteobacteria bacterium]|jgi:ribosome-binding factor A|nr:30S ribosome-binding factor RbfA [Gammaproteobacteria bacterium]
MPKEFTRARRIGEQLQRELAVLIPQEVKDPRLGMITVSAVKVSSDLSHARVYVTVLGKESDEAAESVRILNGAGPFLRQTLFRRMKLRIMPHLQFVHDDAMVEGNRLAALIERSVAEDKKKSGKES